MSEKTIQLDPVTSDFITELYQKHYEILLNYVLRNMKICNPAIGEDIVHDTFYEAMKKADILKNHVNPGGWLMITTKYKIMAAQRRACNQDIFFDDNIKYDKGKVEEKYNLAELELILDKELNEKEKKLFYMYMQGYTNKEMAEVVNITEGNVKVRMVRLRKKLAERFAFIFFMTLLISLHWINL